MLTPKQREWRKGRLTASRVHVLMGEDAAAINQLWEELTGLIPEQEIEQTWAMRLGECTEQLHLDQYERKHGPIKWRGEQRSHPKFESFGCTLDGWDIELDCPIEVKHVGGYEDMATLIKRYYPQLHWQMFVCGRNRCRFSVIFGASEPIAEIVDRNDEYMTTLQERCAAFLLCVKMKIRPVELPPAALAPDQIFKIVDMTGNNAWANLAAQYHESRSVAVLHEQIKAELRELVPADVRAAHGHGIKVSRDRRGSLSVREDKKENK